MKIDNFLTELKRRNVIRVAGLYLVGAWLLVQVAGTLLPVFDAPAWVMKTLVGVLAVGLVPALIFAWAFELTPQGLKRDEDVRPEESIAPQTARRMNRMIIAVLVLALAYFAFDKFVLAPRREAALVATAEKSMTARPAPDARPAVDPKSIAVLPFKNLSADEENAYFASGMQDMILTRLADVRDLKVVSRSSTEKYKSHPDDLKTIARELGVAHILEGSVQKAGNQVLINVQLIDARTDAHLWAQAYTRTLENIFGVEGEVAQVVAEALKARLTPAEAAAVAKIPTRNKQAYDAYLRSGYYLNNFNRTDDPEDIQQALKLALQATALDPNYAAAFGLVALIHNKMPGHVDEAEAASRRALHLDPADAKGLVNLAFVLLHRRQPEEALAQVREASRLHPNDLSVQYALAYVLLEADQYEAGRLQILRCQELAPTNDFFRLVGGKTAANMRRYGEARDILHALLAKDPLAVNAATELALVEVADTGDLEAAGAALRSVTTSVAASSALSTSWYQLHLYARSFDAAQSVIEAAPEPTFSGQPRALFVAELERARGRPVSNQDDLVRARTQLLAREENDPTDFNASQALAEVEVFLGNREAAVRAADRAIEHAWGDHKLVAILAKARVLAQLDDAKGAVVLLSDDRFWAPGGGLLVTPSLLRLDPVWDSLRQDPRFQKLIADDKAAPTRTKP